MVSNPQKIIHFTSVHPIYDTRIFTKECCSLANAGFDVSLVGPHDCCERIEGVEIYPIPKFKKRGKRIVKGMKYLNQWINKLDGDLYHFHDPELIPLGLKLRRKKKIVIYDIHEDYPRSIFAGSRNYIPRSLKVPVSWLIEIIENFAAKRFSALIAATPKIENRFKKLNPQTEVINNYPIADELYKSNNIDWKKRKNIIVYIGNISAERGIFQIINAMSFLSEKYDARLKIAGNFPQNLDRPELYNFTGWKRTDKLGYLSRNEIANLLSKSKVGLVIFHPDPNHVDSQPNKFFEYMSAGIPIIASDFQNWRDIISRFKCGITVDPMNSVQIAKAIAYILNNPEKSILMGKQGKIAVQDRFNWELEEKKLIKIYHNLLMPKKNY